MGLREEKELQTRNHIMDIAFDLFCKQGIEPTEMMQIAKKARVSRPTVYRYFTSKEVLAEEVYLRNLQTMLPLFTEVPDGINTYTLVKIFLDTFYQELKLQPRALVYDAMYNLYASRNHIDPTTFPEHPFNLIRYKLLLESNHLQHPDKSIRFSGEGDEIMHTVLYPYFSYIQRLAIFSFQKDDTAWEETLREAQLLRDFYLRTLNPE